MKDFLVSSVFFGVVLSIAAFEIGNLIKRRLKLAIFNPLLIAIVIVIAVLSVFDISYGQYKSSADFLSYLLTPATVCLAVPLYEKLELLKKNSKALLCGICAGVLTSAGVILGLSLLFCFDHSMYATLLPKSITTAIGMGISEELGGNATVTIAVIILTGIFGNIFAPAMCRLFKITDPIARGIAIGTSSHAIGTAKALEMGDTEGAMSSLALAVAGVITVFAALLFINLY